MQGAVTRSREQPASQTPRRLLVILPALDEERTVAQVVRGVFEIELTKRVPWGRVQFS